MQFSLLLDIYNIHDGTLDRYDQKEILLFLARFLLVAKNEWYNCFCAQKFWPKKLPKSGPQKTSKLHFRG